MKLSGPFSSGAAVQTGGAGTGTANTDTGITFDGLLHGVYIQYEGSPPAGTTDVTIATKGDGIPAAAVTLLEISNAATDGWFFPRLLTESAAAASNTADYDEYPVHDQINVKIAQANTDDYVQVWFAFSD